MIQKNLCFTIFIIFLAFLVVPTIIEFLVVIAIIGLLSLNRAPNRKHLRTLKNPARGGEKSSKFLVLIIERLTI